MNSEMQKAKPGFLGRLFGTIRVRIRRLLGKRDDPNIYPFF
jgi:hypothetical protein